MTEGIKPNRAAIDAIADLLGTYAERPSNETLCGIIAALGGSAARIMPLIVNDTEGLRDMLGWFNEEVEREALEAFHRHPKNFGDDPRRTC